MAKQSPPPFEDQLVLFRYFLHQLRADSLSQLGQQLNSAEFEGLDENGSTWYCGWLTQWCRRRNAPLTAEQLGIYDENICRHTKEIGRKRGGIRWKYFQYLALLFTELYLDRYFSDPEGFCRALNGWLQEKEAESLGLISFRPYTPDRLNKLAFMCATGSGKTLMMHVNILQFRHYLQRARRGNRAPTLNRTILLSPNEGMSLQHLEELALSSIPAALFDKDRVLDQQLDQVLVIDMNKLKEEGKVKTVSVDSFEQNNLVLVDEGHRGLSGDVWYDYRTRLSAEGFAFEYSATFKQALNAASKKEEERALMEEYGKSILMDYSYRHFYQDGYGKDYCIYNLGQSASQEQRQLYLSGCLLSFYQQLKLYELEGSKLKKFQLEQPLLVFVGNRVTAKTSREELTDIEEVLTFLDRFLRDRAVSVNRLRRLLEDDTGLVDGGDNELFFGKFKALQEYLAPDPALLFQDILRLVFRAGGGGEPRLYLEQLRQVPGEIALRAGDYGSCFGVISIGDVPGLMRSCGNQGIAVRTAEFISRSLFQEINAPNSTITMLIGSRKFTEGWNSWRVSTMGLINFAKGEGSQAIQLFGRGVRLRGWGGCLKRSRRAQLPGPPPKHIELLETLNIFGVRAQYMEDFKNYLEREGAPSNNNILPLTLPTVCRLPKDRTLYTIQVRQGVSFKRQGPRLVLEAPREDFLRYLVKNKSVLDCRSRVQAIESALSLSMESMPEEQTIPPEALPHLDYRRIWEELTAYKREKGYHNPILVQDRLEGILRTDGWYGLLTPRDHLRLDSLAKLEGAADYAVMVLKVYMDKFFRFEKARWEAPLLEYAPLTAEDRNFLAEHTLTYTPPDGPDRLAAAAAEAEEALKKRGQLGAWREELVPELLTAYDLDPCLCAPLLGMDRNTPQLQVSPVALNRGEMLFLERLKDWLDGHCGLAKDLFLLRNQSRSGLGFFEAGNFYPDFILWLDRPDRQDILFLDPKGLMRVSPTDPKVEFHRTIKELEGRLTPPAGKKIALHSFLLSSTPSSLLRQSPWGSMDQDQREALNVYTLDDPRCIDKLMSKIIP